VLLALTWFRLEELCAAVEAQPREAIPVLGPAVDEEGRLGQHEEVADARQPLRVRRALGLLVERAVQARAAAWVVVGREHEADRDEAWPPVGILGREDGFATRSEEDAFGRRQRRRAFHERNRARGTGRT
jgi:hypothetical protein